MEALLIGAMECILVPDSGILMLVMIILCVIRIAGGVDIAPKECCIRVDGLFVFSSFFCGSSMLHSTYLLGAYVSTGTCQHCAKPVGACII